MKPLHVFILMGLLLLAVVLYLEKCRKTNTVTTDNVELVNALNDSVRYYKNKDGQNVATISVLQTENAKAFTRLQIKDIEVQKLQDVVREYAEKLVGGSSVTTGTITTDITGTNPTVIIKRDTVFKDSVAYVYPTYKDSIKDKWLDYVVVMNQDSTTRRINITNEFSLVVGRDKNGPFVDMTTDNPYSTVKTLRTYQVKVPPQKRIGIGFNGSYGFNHKLERSIYFGVGIQYSFIRL